MRSAIATSGLLLLAACGGPSGEQPAPGTGATGPAAAPVVDLSKDPAALPPGLPPPSGLKLLAENPPPEAFDDPTVAAPGASYLPGTWKSLDQGLLQEAEGPGNKLMVRRYVGPGAGKDGVLPDKYRVQVTEWQYHFKGRDPVRDMGVLALIPIWKDAKHFLILSAHADVAELWAANDTEPGQTWPAESRFWTRSLSPPLGVGDAVTWDVEVDTAAHRIAVHMNGELKVASEGPQIAGPPQVALAANGNQVKFRNFRLWGGTP